MTVPGDRPTSAVGEQLVQLARTIEPLVELTNPPAEAEISGAEARLGVRLPGELRAFLLRSDGATIAVRRSSGELVERASPLVWSLSEILTENGDFPSHGYNGAERVLFFASAGVGGVLFGHVLQGSRLRDDVVAWYPIEQRLEPCASSFAQYLEGWLKGEISV